MELNQKENELLVYSINEKEYIGVVNLSCGDNHWNSHWSSRFFVILENSSVAGDAAVRLVKEILPLVNSKVEHLGDSLHLITFGDGSVYNDLSESDLSKFDLKTGGAANIGIAIEKLRENLTSIGVGWGLINILTISTGEISDRENAEQETKKLIDFLAKNDFRINSQAVRLSTTSYNHQPDTKALSYLLQINNSTEANICDVNITSSNEVIASQIAALFPENIATHLRLDVADVIISPFPWTPSKLLAVWSGWNIFWLSQVPTAAMLDRFSNKIHVNVVAKGQLTLETFQQLMKGKLPQIVSHLKILKIVGTAEANKAVDQFFSYFAKAEEDLAVKCSTPNTKVVTNALAGIAMYRSEFRDSAEITAFYRNPNKAIEDQKKMDRLKEVERVKAEEAERQKREDEARQKREDEDRQKREEEDRQKREEEDRQKREEEDRQKREEEDRQKREEEQRQKLEEEERQKREEAAAAHTVDPNDKSNAVQMIFILDEHLSEATENEHLLEKIIPQKLKKMFRKSSQLVHPVTFVRHKSTASQMLQSLFETMDVTKEIRISILTNREEHEIKNLVETVNNFVLQRGCCLFQVETVKITQPAPPTKRYRVIHIDANESNEFIAEQILSQSFR